MTGPRHEISVFSQVVQNLLFTFLPAYKQAEQGDHNLQQALEGKLAPRSRSPLQRTRSRGPPCRWSSGSGRPARRSWRSQRQHRWHPGSRTSWSWPCCSRQQHRTHRRKAWGATSPQGGRRQGGRRELPVWLSEGMKDWGKPGGQHRIRFTTSLAWSNFWAWLLPDFWSDLVAIWSNQFGIGSYKVGGAQ